MTEKIATPTVDYFTSPPFEEPAGWSYIVALLLLFLYFSLSSFSQNVEGRAEFSQQDVDRPVVVR